MLIFQALEPNPLNWSYICRYIYLSEDTLRYFSDKIEFINVSRYQILSENFIRDFKDKVQWNNISFNQKLSLKFIMEFEDKINFINLSCNYHLTEDIIKYYIKRFSNDIILNNLINYNKYVSPKIKSLLKVYS